jgi:uncharacterized protein YktA (UPF0223 family)
MGYGVIVDFYSDFKNDYGVFDLHKTSVGEDIYKYKYYTKPPLSQPQKDFIIDSLYQKAKVASNDFFNFINSESKFEQKVRFDDYSTYVEFIPSKSELPNNLAKRFVADNKVNTLNLISKVENNMDSKNCHTFLDSYLNAYTKYSLNDVDFNTNKTFVVIDDVFGFGGSMVRILELLYKATNHPNYFIILAKDVKR